MGSETRKADHLHAASLPLLNLKLVLYKTVFNPMPNQLHMYNTCSQHVTRLLQNHVSVERIQLVRAVAWKALKLLAFMQSLHFM